MMKPLYSLLLLAGLAACSAPDKPESAQQSPAPAPTAAPAVGNDKDAHGCLGSAGYTWSQLRQECIRMFEAGQRLNPVQAPADGAVLSAFVVFGADKTKLELFLPNQPQSAILPQTSPDQYQAGPYRYDASAGTLSIEGAKAYQREQ